MRFPRLVLLRLFYLLCLLLAACKPPAQEAPPTTPLVDLPPKPLLSPAGYQLILDFEVGGGASYYNKILRFPTWPGYQSGVTVGVGYDLGYNIPLTIRADWKALRAPAPDRLAGVSGVTGAAAKPLVSKVKDIEVPWSAAEEVFNRVSLSRFYDLTRKTYPGFEKLRPNAQAALVSITFNRGSSMTGDRRKELRQIRDAVPRQDYKAMAAANRASMRLWRGTDIEKGMQRRREAESKLIETK